MNTNSYDKIYEPVVNSLENILYQLLNYNSISIDNIRKLLLIIYNQNSLDNPNKTIDNLINTILFNFTTEVNIYDDKKKILTEPIELVNLFLNNNFQYLIENED